MINPYATQQCVSFFRTIIWTQIQRAPPIARDVLAIWRLPTLLICIPALLRRDIGAALKTFGKWYSASSRYKPHNK